MMVQATAIKVGPTLFCYQDDGKDSLNETLRWTRSTLAPFALVRLYSLVPHLLPVVLIIPVATICARAFPVACLSRRFDHAILLAFHLIFGHNFFQT